MFGFAKEERMGRVCSPSFAKASEDVWLAVGCDCLQWLAVVAEGRAGKRWMVKDSELGFNH